MPTIQTLKARQILDSRGTPTVEVDCLLSDGSFGRAEVPSGVSAGKHEAVELRDGDKKIYGGKSVHEAVTNVEGMLAVLKGVDVADQREVDGKMIKFDGTPHKSKLGANAMLAVSVAVCKARAFSEKKPIWRSLAEQYGVPSPTLLPVPMAVVIEAGVHSDAGLAFQEFMIMPTGFGHFSDALRAGVETYHMLKKLLKAEGHVTAVGDEGACAPRLRTCAEAFDFIARAIEEAGYGTQIKLALDAAASEFYQKGIYTVDGKKFSSAELTAFYVSLCDRYPIVSIEDSHSEDDWDGFQAMRTKLGDRLQLIGDDLLVTNVERIKEAVEKEAVNAVLIKLNQIGTVSETVDAVLLTQKQGWHAIVSHRGGDTEDPFMADFAVAFACGQIKTTFNRGERTCKYNQLLRIEEELGSRATYASPF
ncbi:MAG: phosphopyruvate hydratase [Candidatus Peregrinibacteria bacterium]